MQPRKGEEALECQRAGCRCSVSHAHEPARSHEQGNAIAHYCSEECARDEGCGHVECACGALLDA